MRPGIPVGIHESAAVDSVLAFPSDGKARVSFLKVDVLRVAVSGQPRSQVIFRIEQPCIPGVGREQRQRANRHETAAVFGGTALDVSDLVGKVEVLALDVPLARPVFDGFPAHRFLPWVEYSSDGTIHPAFRRSADFGISLLSTRGRKTGLQEVLR